MASIYSPRADKWTVQWSAGRDRTGKVIRDSQTFDGEQAAIHFKHEIEQRQIGTGKESLSTRGLHWIDDRFAVGSIGEKTAIGYKEKLGAWGRLIGSTPYKKLTSADLDRAFARLAQGQTPSGRVPSARTLHHYRRVLTTFFNAMERKGEISHNPARGLEPPRGLKERTKRAPTRSEMQAMLTCADASDAAHGLLGAILRIGSHLGLRRGEICALQWRDIDFDAMTVSITRAATQPSGGATYFKEPKSDAGIRTLAMLEPTAQVLRAQRQVIAAWRLKLGKDWSDNDLIFCDPLGQVLNMEVLSIQARRIRDTADVPGAVSPLHGCRHYSLTQLHKAGVDGLTIRSRAGHADIRSTVGYITIDSDDDRKAAEAIRGALL